MTVSKKLEIRCDNCRETKTWTLTRNSSVKSLLESYGYTKKHHGWWKGSTHWCPDCNDREKHVFYVYDGRGEEFLGEVRAWNVVDARRVAWDRFEEENMVKRERV